MVVTFQSGPMLSFGKVFDFLGNFSNLPTMPSWLGKDDHHGDNLEYEDRDVKHHGNDIEREGWYKDDYQW